MKQRALATAEEVLKEADKEIIITLESRGELITALASAPWP